MPIDDAAWQALLQVLPWLARVPAAEVGRLRELIALFLTRHSITGAHAMEISDSVRLWVAAQACLPVLRLGLGAYDRFAEVVIYPSAFRVKRRIESASGAVAEFDDVLAGEAIDGGPVILSLPDAREMVQDNRNNLIIHEFAHKLDLANGQADGCPPMSTSRRRQWEPVLHQAFEDFNRMLDRVEQAIPPDIDPESEQAAPWFDLLPLDPYAATDPAEFFAVATEKFFVEPEGLSAEFPELYAQMAVYFGLDPRSWARLELTAP
jgi:Mlc titration factor MtfA (ptsG expression regulator)